MIKNQKRHSAETILRIKEQRKSLNIKLDTTPKKCLSCGEIFESEGKHNRLCGLCRHHTGGLGT